MCHEEEKKIEVKNHILYLHKIIFSYSRKIQKN